jgi:anaphase-promoting complex subunit 8
MKMFYLALACLELHLNEEAMGYYLRMARTGFEKSTYVISQLALAAYNLKDFSKSLERFQELRLCDPYRLNCVDVFSHILFVKEMLPELTILAQGCVEVDRFRFETLCAIANLYSLRGEHEKAVTYFEMAVKVNLADQSACVLLGHEYLELKNLPMAIEAYSRGVEVNRKDFRGYYGLGQAYELMKVPNLALHFYMKAHKLKPNDSRMLVALGDCYSILGRIQEAKKCYKHAIGIGDYEQTAVLKLAKLHEQLGQMSEAATHYERYVAQAESQGGTQLDNVSKACIVLAKHHLERGNLQEAEGYAEKASKVLDTQAEGKSLLNEVATRRAKMKPALSQQEASIHLLDFEISPIT